MYLPSEHAFAAGSTTRAELVFAAQKYWGVLDILAIDCEATAANRQLAQEYAISGFPTFVLLHKGRRVDQVRTLYGLSKRLSHASHRISAPALILVCGHS